MTDAPPAAPVLDPDDLDPDDLDPDDLDPDNLDPDNLDPDDLDPDDLRAATQASPLAELTLPDPEDDRLPEHEFRRQIDAAWQACDRADLQADIWRGRILRAVRDREKQRGDGRGTGFLNWLKDRELSKSQAYRLIELADSADALAAADELQTADLERFSKRAFVETAKAPPEVQHLVAESARHGNRITQRDVRQLADEWAAVTSDLLPEPVREKAADHSLPARYVAPLVRELEKLPDAHRQALQEEVAEEPTADGVKQATAQARYLSRYLEAASQVQALDRQGLDLELALEEALRVGALNFAADAVRQAAQLEQALARTYTAWKRLGQLRDRLYVDSGSSTPHLRHLIDALGGLASDRPEVPLAGGDRWVRATLEVSGEGEDDPDEDANGPISGGPPAPNGEPSDD